MINLSDLKLGEAYKELYCDISVAIMKKPEGAEQMPDNWGTYITVDDVDETLAKVEVAGGKAIYPPMDVPGVGRMCAITDRSGAMISIITYEDKECDETSK